MVELSVALLGRVMGLFKTGEVTLPTFDGYEALRKQAGELQNVNLRVMSERERVVFFTNVFNTLCIHAHLVFGSSKARGFFSAPCYQIGGMLFNLGEIEHNILRGGRPVPSSHMAYPVPPFSASDSRAVFAMSSFDKRLPFAMTYGSTSSPLVRVLCEERFDDTLDQAVADFLGFSMQANSKERTIMLPFQFKWFHDEYPEPLSWVTSFIKNKTNRRILEQLASKSDIKVLVRLLRCPVAFSCCCY